MSVFRFLTNEEFPFKSHSENFSALLALFHLEPSRPYEKLFPSPFREAWLSLSGETPQQQQQQQAAAAAGAGPKKPSAKAKAAKGAANSQSAASAKAAAPAADSSNNGLSAAGAGEAAAAAAAGTAAAASKPSGLGPPSGGPLGVSDACPSNEASGAPTGAPFCVQISSAHRYASVFEKQQADESKRLEKVKREKEKELQRLEEEAQMPTVFMAELVRKKTAQTLRELLPHVVAARCDPAATAAAAAPGRRHCFFRCSGQTPSGLGQSVGRCEDS